MQVGDYLNSLGLLVLLGFVTEGIICSVKSGLAFVTCGVQHESEVRVQLGWRHGKHHCFMNAVKLCQLPLHLLPQEHSYCK